MLDLSEHVTLVCIDNVCHDLALLAIRDSCAQVKFHEVLWFTDSTGKAETGKLIGIDSTPGTILPYDGKTLQDYQAFLWYEAWRHVRTTHFLIVQWDGWVIDAGMWRDHWLGYDYIGAPWRHSGEYRVGNGGFSLRSWRLHDWLDKKQATHPLRFPEDWTIGRLYADDLAKAGLKIATYEDALDFSFECCRTRLEQRHFGFHAFRNWPFVLNKEQLERRFALVTPYVMRDKQYMFLQSNAQGLLQRGLSLGYGHVVESAD